MRRILSIDGGGIKGAIPASFLATLERATGARVADHFDLIAGTSTGGIIALGLGLGFSAGEILAFYANEGPRIFATFGPFATLRQVRRSKYQPDALRSALEAILGSRRLGDSTTRLVIPAFDSTRGEVHVFKTSHHPRLEIDYRVRAVDVAMATAAAPTYFPAHQIEGGAMLVDGGIWANNPVGLTVVEGISVLNWPAANIRVLSLGCTNAPLDVPADMGYVANNLGIIELMFSGQSAGSVGTAKLLLGHNQLTPKLFRIDPTVAAGTFRMDDVSKFQHLVGLGEAVAREFLPTFRVAFQGAPRAPFVPCHRL